MKDWLVFERMPELPSEYQTAHMLPCSYRGTFSDLHLRIVLVPCVIWGTSEDAIFGHFTQRFLHQWVH